MKISFTIKERLALPSILPQRSGLATMILVDELQRKVRITSEEVQQLGMIDTENGTIWDASKEKEILIEVSERELQLLKESAQRVDKEEEVDMSNFSLIKKLL